MLASRCKKCVLNTRCNNLKGATWLAIQRHELTLLFGTTNTDHVCATDDFDLFLLTVRRLVVSTLSLNSCQCMECGDERNVEFVLDLVASNSRHPVVRVHYINATVCLDVLNHFLGEVINVSNQFILRESVRSSWDVDNTMVGLNIHNSCCVTTRLAGVHGALDPNMGER